MGQLQSKVWRPHLQRSAVRGPSPLPLRYARAAAQRALSGGHLRGLPGAEAGQVDPTGMGGDQAAAGLTLVVAGVALRRLLSHSRRCAEEHVRKRQGES